MPLDAAANPSPPPITPTRPAASHATLNPTSAALTLVILSAIALLLRTLHLTSRSFTLDDGFSAFLARTSFADLTHWLWSSELNMALYYGLLRLWVHLGAGEFAIRMLSVVFGAATIPVVYLLGSRLFGRRAAIVAALLMTVHPAHLALSQDARSYSLTVLLVSLSALMFLRTLQSPSVLNTIAYAIVTALAVYSHFFAVLVILAQALALLFMTVDMRTWKNLLTATLLLAALLAPIAFSCPIATPRTRLGARSWRSADHWTAVLSDALQVPLPDLSRPMGSGCCGSYFAAP